MVKDGHVAERRGGRVIKDGHVAERRGGRMVKDGHVAERRVEQSQSARVE